MTAIAHYRAELQALHDMGIRPLVTVLHFSVPVWVGDPRAISCPDGPTDANLCGFGSPGGPRSSRRRPHTRRCSLSDSAISSTNGAR